MPVAKSASGLNIKPVKPPPAPLTIADLPDAERAKVSRLVERLVTLGKEHQETVDKLASLQVKSEKDSADAQGRNEADVERLTAVITAIEAQRASAFKMLMQYQLRLEQLAGLMKKMEADSISGDRKVAFVANMKQLENIVENQKTMIISFQKERTNTANSHQQELELANEKIKRSEKEVRKQMDMMLRAERRTSAIEMACSRLTKQITEMTRRDSSKQAEIDALKRLLAERPKDSPAPVRNSHFTGGTDNTGTAPVSLPLDTDSTASDVSAFETSASESNQENHLASKKRESTKADKVAAEASRDTSHAASSVPVPSSPPRSTTASPKRKLSTALHTSRGEPVPENVREPSAAKVSVPEAVSMSASTSTTMETDLVKTILTLGATAGTEVPELISPRKKALTTYTGSPVKRNSSPVLRKTADKDPSTPTRSVKSSSSRQSRQSNKSVQTSTVKALKVDRRERKAEIEAERQRVMEKRKAKLLAKAQVARLAAREAARESRDVRLAKEKEKEKDAVSDRSTKGKKESKEIESEKQAAPVAQRLTRVRVSTVPPAAPPSKASSKRMTSASGTNAASKQQPGRSPRPKLNVLLGENKMYDTGLLDLLDDMDMS